jgi:Phosphate-selective porin O and P
MNSNRSLLSLSAVRAALWPSAVLVTVWSSGALAQPTPTPAPAPAADPAAAPPASPTAADVAAQPPVTTEPEVPAQVEPSAKEAAPAPKKDEKPALKAVYDKGLVFSTEDGAFEAKLSLRNQIRFEVLRPLDGVDEFQSRFLINRVRLQLEGHAYGKDNRYKMEVALDDGGSFSFVKDAYVERKVSSVWMRIGQWKRPYNRQEITSDFSSEFNERAVTNDFAGGGRSIGFAVHNDYEKSADGLEWVVGVFNSFSGGGDRPAQTITNGAPSRPTNVPADFGPAFVGRVGWNLGKIKGYSEGDLEGGPLRLAVAASYKIDLANFAKGAQSSKTDNWSHGAEVDAILKNEGLDVAAGLYLQKVPGVDAQVGALFQAGYFVTPKQVQLGGRFALHQVVGDRYQLEGRAALNYYFAGHGYKIATDYGFLQLTGKDAAGVKDKADLQARIMAQLTF